MGGQQNVNLLGTMSNPVCGLFVVGTDTDVGKTYVAALMAKSLAGAGYRVGVYKPVASGCTVNGEDLLSTDAQTLWLAAGEPWDLERVCPQRFAAPLAPHLAARAEGKEIDGELLRAGLEGWLERSDVVIIEGAGGLMSPLTDDEFVADLAYDFGFPLVVVSPNVLGTINATLQTLITASTFRDGLEVAGIVLNHPAEASNDVSRSSNRREIERLAVPPVLGEVAHRATQFDSAIDWFALAAPRKNSR
jgi:dethiobiotin synthetase